MQADRPAARWQERAGSSDMGGAAPDQAEEAVGVEDKVGLGGGAVADEGVHAPDLEVAGHQLQVAVDAPQLRLLQLHADVLRDQVNRHLILLPAGEQMSKHAQTETACSPNSTWEHHTACYDSFVLAVSFSCLAVM